MKHTIHFIWDEEEAAMIVDAENAAYLHALHRRGIIRIIKDETALTRALQKTMQYLQTSAVPELKEGL